MRSHPFPIRLIAACALVLALLQAPAQTPDSSTVNNQDEVVNFVLPLNTTPEQALALLRSDDKFETNRYITRVFELRHVWAFELRPYIEQTVALEKGAVRAAATITPEGVWGRSFLVVSTTPAQMPTIEAAIQTLDTPGFQNAYGLTRRAFRVQHRLASELAPLLARTRLSNQGRVVADDRTNTIYFDDSDSVVKSAESFLAFYDVPTPQVEFDIRIVEIREGDGGRLGLDWDAWKRSVGGTFGVTLNRFETGDTFARLDALLTLDAVALASFLQYTVERGNARLVQRSRLSASNLEPAVISDLRRLPRREYRRSERTPAVVTEVNPRAGAAREQDDAGSSPRVVTIVPPVNQLLTPIGSDQEGIRMSIVPVIGVRSVSARIVIEVYTLQGFDAEGQPLVAEQTLRNHFTLQDGREILLGTVERRTEVKSRRGIPGLKDIPILKYLFSVESTREETARMFLIATPRFSNVHYDAMSLADLPARPTMQQHESTMMLMDDGLAMPDSATRP